jgi:hypothetical protein
MEVGRERYARRKPASEPSEKTADVKSVAPKAEPSFPVEAAHRILGVMSG